jgi:hypothetical protein
MDANSTNSRPPSMLKLVLWTGLWLLMCLWAIIGVFFVLLALLSFFVDISSFGSMTLFRGEPVRTTQQKVIFLLVGLGLATIGIGFLWLVRRGTIKEPV